MYNFTSAATIRRESRQISLIGGYGGISPTWEEYKNSAPKDIQPVLDAFLKFIRQSQYYGGGAMTINDKRRDGLYWKFYIGNDIKWSISFSFRAWGDFMAAAENICEAMGYMEYY